MNLLTIGGLADPIKNFLNNAKDEVLDAGGPLIILAGVIMFILFMVVGLFALKKSPKAAFVSWGFGAIAIIASVMWVVFRNIFTDVGEAGRDDEWTNAIQFAALIPTMYAAYKYKKVQNKQEIK